ncbi:hypothetical protein BKX93_01455 [Chromobacterium vaccinii]|uniref:Excisionase n=1 Tax=Chromobacterium vaccinii TaxID=1108595 RepID=A0A1D9LC31_9NEIS|nr:hypothetical protein BKX93_01455 [Chromobacterium vaccinii]
MDNQIAYLPITWVRADMYCRCTGEPMDAVSVRIREGHWAAGKHYKRTAQRVLWINLIEAAKWVEQQPNVEGVFQKGSKSGKDREEAA